MNEIVALDKFHIALQALEQTSRELHTAHATITRKQEENEQLRAAAEALVETQEALMFQLKKALLLVEQVKAYAAKADAALEVERWERDRVTHELALVVEAVGRLLHTLSPNLQKTY